MRILKVSLAIVALAAPIATARAQEATAAAPASDTAMSGGWTDTWALLFELNNIFQVDSILSEYNGGIGGQYYLAPDMAVRLVLDFGRSKNPISIYENVDETAGVRDVRYTLSRDPTSGAWTTTSNLRLSADFLYRLSRKAIAPYVGGGLYVSTYRYNLKFVDDSTTVNQVTTYKGYDRSTYVGLTGMVGAEWRFHPSFAVVAEYAVDVLLLGQTSTLTDTVTEVTIDGERTVRHVSSKSSAKTAPTFGQYLRQGASLGLAVNF